MTVADRLAENDDVRHDLLRFESVEMRADAAVRRLHLVGDADAAGATHVRVNGGEIPGRKNELTADAGAALRDECADAIAGLAHPLDGVANRLRVLFACPGVILYI